MIMMYRLNRAAREAGTSRQITGCARHSGRLAAALACLAALLAPWPATASPPASDVAGADLARDTAGAAPEATNAQPSPRRADPAGDHVYLALGEVVIITDKASGPLDTASLHTSVNIIGADQLRRENVSEPLEALRRVPAVYMETFNQGVISSDIGIRGFNTQGDIAHTKLLIDGIPSNLHIGYADLKAVFPMEIERLEVVKGTNDPRYGLHNIAGNVNVMTHKSGDARQVRVLAGSFGTVEPQALLGLRTGRVTHTYFGGYRSSSGYRDNSGLDKAAGSGKWFVDIGDRTTVGLILRGLVFDGDAPGYLSAEQAQAAPESVVPYATDDGGRQRNAHASLHLDHRLSDSLSWVLKAYAQSVMRARWVRFDADAGQQERVEDEAHYGAISVLTLRPELPVVSGVAVEWGVDYQLQDNLHQRFATMMRERTGDALRHQQFSLGSLGSYLQGRARPVRMVLLTAGLRADHLSGTLSDERSGMSYGLNDYGLIWQPKASAVLTPITGHSVYANYGRTFQIGVGLGAYKTQDSELAPSINDGFEVGYKTSPVRWLSARLAYWQQYASNEVRLRFDDSGESENIGETRRAGFDVELSVEPRPKVTIWAAYSRHDSEQVEPGIASPERLGKELDHVPSFSAKGGVSVGPLARISASLWVYSQGDYYLTKENDGERYGDYTLVNADMAYQLTPWAELGVQVKNLLAARYDSTVWYKDFGTVATQHNPGEGRSLYVTTTATF